MSELFGLLADQYPEVEEFWEKVLGERFPLSSDEAHALIASCAARAFSPEWFVEWGIPIVGHHAQIFDTGPRGEQDGNARPVRDFNDLAGG